MLAVMQSAAADVVIGSRYIPGGGTRNWGLARLLMSRFACLLARRLTPIRDATSGFFLIRRDLARDVRISAGGFKICLELLVRGRPASVVEVPYVFVGRTAGESKMNSEGSARLLGAAARVAPVRRSHPKLSQTYRRISPRGTGVAEASTREPRVRPARS